MKAIQTINLTKRYGKHRGIENVGLAIDEGDFFGFIGPNGAGKSTTIRTLLGLIFPTSGTAEIFGKQIVNDKTEILAQVGYLPSEAIYYGNMRVRDILSFAAKSRRINCKKEAAQLCENRVIVIPTKNVAMGIAAVVAFHLPWQMMHVLTIGTMCFVILVQLTLCKPFCPMPQRMPLKGIDITTGLLMSVLMLMVSYFLVYGDYLMWFRSPRLRWIVALTLILLAFILYRLKTVEKPYISLEIFRYKNVVAILLVTVVAELLLGAEHTLEEIYWSEVRGLEEHTKTGLCLWSLPGVYAGVVITLFWLGHRKWKVWKLFAIGFGCIMVYAIRMYFLMDLNVPITAYRWALVFRGCAYAVLAVSLMWSLHESVHELEHFFMALFIFNVIHMYLAGASGYGLYTSLFQHFMADNMSRYSSYLTLTGVDMQQFDMNGFMNGYYLHSMMSVTLKQIFGQIIWATGFMTMAFLLLDIPRVRTGIEKVPYWPVYGIKMLARG